MAIQKIHLRRNANRNNLLPDIRRTGENVSMRASLMCGDR